MSNTRITIVEDVESFRRLAGPWAALLGVSDAAGVFNGWHWRHTWWQHYAHAEDALRIWTAWRGERLVGLLPMYQRRALSLLPGSGQVLRFIGTGEPEADEVATEYSDLLLDPDCREELLPQAIDWLLSFAGWQRVELRCLLEDALLARGLAAATGETRLLSVSAGLRYRVRADESEAQHFARLGGSRARRIERSRRAIDKAGGLQVRHVTAADEIEGAFRDLAELNNERQVDRRRKSVFASTAFRDFHRAVFGSLHPMGQADIVRFSIGHRLVAALYCFYGNDTVFYYQSGFSSRDANRFMPLTIGHLVEIERARQQGRHFYDLMRGRPPCYKDDFGCETDAMVNLTLFDSAWRRYWERWLQGRRRRVVGLLERLGLRRP